MGKQVIRGGNVTRPEVLGQEVAFVGGECDSVHRFVDRHRGDLARKTPNNDQCRRFPVHKREGGALS